MLCLGVKDNQPRYTTNHRLSNNQQTKFDLQNQAQYQKTLYVQQAVVFKELVSSLCELQYVTSNHNFNS